MVMKKALVFILMFFCATARPSGKHIYSGYGNHHTGGYCSY